MKSVLFISPYNFSENNGGKYLFNEFFKRLKSNKLSWFICSESDKNKGLNYEFNSINYCNSFIFDNKYFNLISRKLFFIGIFFFYVKYNFYSKIISKKVCLNIEENSIDKLWIYASHTTIPVLFYVIKKNKIQYHLSIQDDFATHLPSFEGNLLSEKFKYIIENANSIDFISSSMENYYKLKYTINCDITVFYISNQIDGINKPVINNKLLNISYAGNIWCGETFIPLLNAIKKVNNSNNNREIKLRLYSQNMPRKLFKNFLDIIEFKEFKEYGLLLNELQKSDLLYLPMTFKEGQTVVNITSFPSKIITYLNSGIPILNHSPENSATHLFVKDYSVGFSICTMNQNDFVNLLTTETYNLRIKYSLNSSEVLKTFNADHMMSQLSSLIFDKSHILSISI